MHPRGYGNFPRLIARYVRERKSAHARRSDPKNDFVAGDPNAYSPSRGLIKEGNWADVVIFDYDKIQDHATYEQPRFSPVGIDYVLVNGQVVIEQGKHTGARPGQMIYGPGRRAQ